MHGGDDDPHAQQPAGEVDLLLQLLRTTMSGEESFDLRGNPLSLSRPIGLLDLGTAVHQQLGEDEDDDEQAEKRDQQIGEYQPAAKALKH